jgi:nifR3 family TIM-barrel protein
MGEFYKISIKSMHYTYRSDINRTTATAQPGEFTPLSIGNLQIWPPVVLAPMAGITNAPFRTLCRGFGAGLYVSEMITARLLVEKDPYTLKLASFAEGETPRSIQLYGIDPFYIGKAAAWLAGEQGADHIDLNFGCPAPKVTRSGGGAAIPLKPNLFRNLVCAAVRNAGDIPVTVKFRIGINEQYHTYLIAGKIAEEEGCAAVALHARTAAELYSGEARWEKIARLKQIVTTIPVLGNGDIWEAWDALRMMRCTGCDGVVVGRGCLGRPWFFRDLREVFEGREPQTPPNLREVANIMRQHARLLCQWLEEKTAIRTFRKHCNWYLKGFRGDAELLSRLMPVETFDNLDTILSQIPDSEPFPLRMLRSPRGKNGLPQKVALPAGYLDNLDDDTPPGPGAEDPASGG